MVNPDGFQFAEYLLAVNSNVSVSVAVGCCVWQHDIDIIKSDLACPHSVTPGLGTGVAHPKSIPPPNLPATQLSIKQFACDGVTDGLIILALAPVDLAENALNIEVAGLPVIDTAIYSKFVTDPDVL